MSPLLATSGPERRRRSAFAVVFVCLLVLPRAAWGAEWRVMLEGSDVTSEARAFESGGELIVDATRLAPLLGISIRPGPDGVTILDRDGVEWRGQVGTPRLQSLLRSLELPTALRFDGGSLLLPVGVVAELAGLQVAFDRKTKTILFRSRLRSKPETKPRPTPQSAPAPGPAPAPEKKAGDVSVAPGDWQFFELPKPREEIVEQQRRAATRPAATFVPSLPPPREALRMGFGVAAIQGGDYANEINALGTIGGVDTQLNSLLTYGDAGVQFYSGHLGLADPSRRWMAEAGDLFSDIWGFARGARMGWLGRVHRPQLSVYVEDERTPLRRTVVALADEIFLTRRFSIGGEGASDGSWLARTSLRHDRFGFTLYARDPASGRDLARGAGGSAYLNLFGVAVQGSASRSGEGDQRFEFKNGLVRLPLWRGADVTADRTETESRFGRTEMTALSLGVPIRGLQLRTRYQQLVSERSPFLPGQRFEQNVLTASVGYTLGSRGRFDLQTYHVLAPVRGASTQQLFVYYRLSSRTSLEAVANRTSIASAVPQYRYRVQHAFTRNLALVVEYGQIPPYQNTTVLTDGFDEPRFKVMVRRSWDVSTPARGGRISGVVADELNRPVAGVPVRIGKYLAVTDSEGRYRFEHVPPGKYEISIDEKGVPAAYAPRVSSRSVDVKWNTVEEIDWTLVPATGSIAGIVYIDRNNNGKPDVGEFLPGAVVFLDGRFTTTGTDGQFAFYNLIPGQYRVRLDTTRLPERVVGASAGEFQVSVPAAASVPHLVFRLVEKAKPTVFQKVN